MSGWLADLLVAASVPAVVREERQRQAAFEDAYTNTILEGPCQQQTQKRMEMAVVLPARQH